MLTSRVIPCLDVRNGRVVKGVKFQGLRDAGCPVEAAARYASEGADELVIAQFILRSSNGIPMLTASFRNGQASHADELMIA